MVLLEALSAIAFIAGLVYIASIFIFLLPARHAQPSKNLPFVSVVIATRNEEQFIGSTLKKLKKMDYPKLEIIVVDSSTDRTAEIAKKYAKVIKDRGRGKPQALNLGVRRARGEVIYVVDADTLVEKDTLRKLVSALDGNYEAAAGLNLPSNRRNAVARIGRLELAFLNLINIVIFRISKSAVIPGRNFVICKKTLGRIGGFKNVLTEDVNLAWRLYRNGVHTALVPVMAKERVPATLKGFVRQKERWCAGTVAEMKSAAGQLPSFERFVLLPYIALLSSAASVMAISLVIYAVTSAGIFLLLSLLAFLTFFIPAMKYLDMGEAILSPIFSLAYGIIMLYVIISAAMKGAKGEKMTWLKTPK